MGLGSPRTPGRESGGRKGAGWTWQGQYRGWVKGLPGPESRLTRPVPCSLQLPFHAGGCIGGQVPLAGRRGRERGWGLLPHLHDSKSNLDPNLGDTDPALAEPPTWCTTAPPPLSEGYALLLARIASALPARFPSALPEAGFQIFLFPLLARKKKKSSRAERKKKKLLLSLLARYVSGHLVPAPDRLGLGSKGRGDRCLGVCRPCCPGWSFLPPPQRVRDVDPGLAGQDDWEEARPGVPGRREAGEARTATFGPEQRSEQSCRTM